MTKINDIRKIKVESRYIAALHPFSAREDVRFYLHGIFITPHPEKGVLMMASNGHVAGVIHDVNGESNGSYLCEIPEKILRACQKLKSPAKQVYFIDKLVTVTTKDADMESAVKISGANIEVLHAPAIDGKFPFESLLEYIKKSYEHDEKGHDAGVNLEYLKFMDWPCRISIGGSRHINFHIFGKHDAMRISVNGLQEFVSLIMPLRDDFDYSVMPEWLSASTENISKKNSEAA